MRILRELIHCDEPTAVALGFFDGVHLGHRQVLESAVKYKSEGLVPTAFIFSRTPKQNDRGRQLLTFDEKIKRFEMLGIEQLYVIDFESMRDTSPEDFVEKILSGVFNARRVFCGFNYHFGAGGSGDTAALKRLCGESGITASVSEPVEVDGAPVSSSRIRALLQDGDVATANRLLGYEYGYSGEVVEGNHLGAAMQTPTINLEIPGDIMLLRFGVYASLVNAGGKVYPGVTNIGVKPTVADDNAPNCETWMLGYDGGELYGERVEVRLIGFIRAEKRFPSMLELERAIKSNAETALKMIKRYSF